MATDAKQPESTAARVSLWRAMHVENDAAPHVLEDTIGLKMLNPDPNWRQRGDMHPIGTAGYRASIVARSRRIEDLVADKLKQGVTQYVILGAGLDTFAQRKPEIASRLTVFEVDQPGPQAWKQERLAEMGYKIPEWLKFVPVNFENQSWMEQLVAKGFDKTKPSVIVSTGVSMYLTHEANMATLCQIAGLAKGTTLAMTFMIPLELINAEERPQHAMVYERAKASGTPFISFFKPDEMLQLAREAGFHKAEHISSADQNSTYFKGRSDGLKSADGEWLLIATV